MNTVNSLSTFFGGIALAIASPVSSAAEDTTQSIAQIIEVSPNVPIMGNGIRVIDWWRITLVLGAVSDNTNTDRYFNRPPIRVSEPSSVASLPEREALN